MAAIGSGNLTLLDQIKRRAPDGSIARVVEVLTQRNAVLQDAVWKEGNLPTGHRFVSRTALPSIAFRRFNEGVATSKSRTAQIDETCGMLEGWSAIDVELAKLNGDEAAFRMTEAIAFAQSMNNQVEQSFIYSSSKTAPEQIMGLSPRMDAITGAQYPNQIIPCSAGASGNDQSSIWLVGWGDTTVYAIYPKGSTGGLEHNDRGILPWDDGTGKKFDAYISNWKWKFGLCVEDARYLVRIPNVDTSMIAANGFDIIEAMVKAYHQIYDPNNARLAFYVNRKIATYLHLQALEATKTSTLRVEDIGGKPVLTFLGVPVRQTDAITNTEAPLA